MKVFFSRCFSKCVKNSDFLIEHLKKKKKKINNSDCKYGLIFCLFRELVHEILNAQVEKSPLS